MALGHELGERIDDAVRVRHRRRLRRVGWEHALDGSGDGYASTEPPPRTGNELEVLVDGAAALPAMAEELSRAESHIHVTGWFMTPHLDLARGDDPLVVRNLLAELAERVDVRLLIWRGAPIPVFRPSRFDVKRVERGLCERTSIRCSVDSQVGFTHSHHEKTIVVDDRVAFVGGIDLTLDGGDPFDSSEHPARGRAGWHDAAVRVRGPAVADVAEHFRMRWRAAEGEELPPTEASGPVGDTEAQVVRTIPERVYDELPRGDFSVLETYVAALRSAERLIYLENQFLWSPEIVAVLAAKLEDPPSDDFRLVVMLPARAHDGADVSCGQVAALIDADAGNGRFFASTLYARAGKLHDLVYVHSKIGIVDDRWLTIGSANLNERSLLNDTEMNVVTLDPRLAKETRLRLWSEHLERPAAEIDRDPVRIVDELWEPIAEEQLERLRKGAPLTHRLVKLPGVSRRYRRLLGPLQGRVFDM